MVDKINYDRILEMYKDRYKDASDFTFFLVGNVDLDKAKTVNRQVSGKPAIYQPQRDFQR